MIRYFDKNVPLTISMWDFSWLTCSHPGGSFADLSRCVAEAATCGYNTLRVDVFPHFYLQKEHAFAPQGLDRRIRSWGDVLVPGGYTVDVRAKVMELANLCRQHGIWLGLDTWTSLKILANISIIELDEEEHWCREWAATWVKALKMMREDGVLERAIWVAPCNEVPLFLGGKLRSVLLADTKKRREGEVDFCENLPELDHVFQRVNHWLGEAIYEEIHRDGIPLSYSSLGAENYGARLTDIYDLVDIHFMPDVILTDEDRIAMEKAAPGASKFSLHAELDTYNLALYGAAWNQACRRNYADMLRLAHAYAQGVFAHTTLSSGKRLPVVVTEAYGPCGYPDHPEVSWGWYKNWNADAARIFSGYDFAGLTLSNYAEPLFNLWHDTDWQRLTNLYILHAVQPEFFGQDE